jgi:hypothetical protein
VQQVKNKKKPSVAFSRDTLNDCIRTDGLPRRFSFSCILNEILKSSGTFTTPKKSDEIKRCGLYICRSEDRKEEMGVIVRSFIAAFAGRY